MLFRVGRRVRRTTVSRRVSQAAPLVAHHAPHSTPEHARHRAWRIHACVARADDSLDLTYRPVGSVVSTRRKIDEGQKRPAMVACTLAGVLAHFCILGGPRPRLLAFLRV